MFQARRQDGELTQTTASRRTRGRDVDMKRCVMALAIVSTLLVFPALARAQASIAGVVKDASGAVLPGVTVEASSPVLIEKTRSVVTDGTGQYRVVDLR